MRKGHETLVEDYVESLKKENPKQNKKRDVKLLETSLDLRN